MQLHGWGRYPIVDAELQSPASAQALTSLLGAGSDQLIARGAGCSYGDSALGKHVISSRFLDNFYSLDEEQGLLHCGAGLTLEQLLAILIPKGYHIFLFIEFKQQLNTMRQVFYGRSFIVNKNTQYFFQSQLRIHYHARQPHASTSGVKKLGILLRAATD